MGGKLDDENRSTPENIPSKRHPTIKKKGRINALTGISKIISKAQPEFTYQENFPPMGELNFT